jgi:hypothetical protein
MGGNVTTRGNCDGLFAASQSAIHTQQQYDFYDVPHDYPSTLTVLKCYLFVLACGVANYANLYTCDDNMSIRARMARKSGLLL